MPGSVASLQEQIRTTFPPGRFVDPVPDCSFDECTDIRQALQFTSWDQVDPAFIDINCEPVFLTPEAFRAFLPAYLLRALDDVTGKTTVLEFTVYSVCPAETRDSPRLHARARLISPAQVCAIRAFLLYAAEHAAEAEYLQPYVGTALETVWL